MHYPSMSMQGGHFDSGGYQSGLYGSLNYDAGTIKLHHSHYPESPENYYSGYSSPTSATGSYVSREPPSYAESTVYQPGFVHNPSSPYYKMPRNMDVSDYGVVRDSVLMKTEIADSGLQDAGMSPRYDTGENRMIPNVDVNNISVTTNEHENLKLEHGVSDFKTDLSLHETISPNTSSDCLSSPADLKETDSSIKSSDNISDTERENADEDKARGNSEIKPALSYIALIAKAILESSQKRLSLGSIYSWIEKNYPFYLNKGQGWRNSVRHNLSLNDCFIKAGRCEDGKGNYWAIHPANIQDFMRGDFRQRRRSRRRGRKKECDLGMYHVTNGYLGAPSPLGPAIPFSPSPALSTVYSPYTEAERRAYRLDDALLRQSMNNPFMKWYHSNNGYGGQQAGCNTGVYGNTSPQWQTGYTDQGTQGVYPINAFSSRNYTTPAIV